MVKIWHNDYTEWKNEYHTLRTARLKHVHHGKYSADACKFVDREVNRTRGNKLKIFQDHVHYILRKHFFLIESFKYGTVWPIL